MVSFKNLILGGVTLLLCFFFSFSVAHAGDRVPYDQELITRLPSSNEDIGIAFLKTTNNFPDFGLIVKETEAYKKLNPVAQENYVSKATGRLQNNFIGFSPQKSDLIIRVKVNVLFEKLANGEGVMKIRTFPDDPVYFPFYFAKYPIALIIKDMELFRELRLDKADTDIVYSRLSLSGDATLLLQLYVLAADDQKPMILDNIPQYPLLAEIGYIGLLNGRAEQIWAWRNSKFSSRKRTSDLVGTGPGAQE